MAVTKHTSVLRGTSVDGSFSHTGVLRTSGSAAPDIDGIFGALDVGDYWIPYDWTTLNQDSGGAGDPVTIAGDPVAYMAGQRTTGTNINLIQANAPQKMEARDIGTSQGIYSPGTTDLLGAGGLTSSDQPILIGFRIRADSSLSARTEIFMAFTQATATNIVGQAYADTSNRNNMYSTSILTGSTFVADTSYYMTYLFDGASSEGKLDGSSDITGNPGTTGSGTALWLGSRGATGNINCVNYQIEKVVFKVTPTAGDIDTVNDWLAIEGAG